MPIQESGGYCDYCKKYVLGRRDGVNHVLHAILFIFTCCLWGIPWLLMSMDVGSQDYACPTCGGKVVPAPHQPPQ